MGETCEVCGREIAKTARDSSDWCWRRLLENNHDVTADYECYKFGFERLQSLYRGWQDEIDKYRDGALGQAYDGVSKQRDEALGALSELVNTIGDGSFVHIECSDAEASRRLEAIEAKCRQLMRVNP